MRRRFKFYYHVEVEDHLWCGAKLKWQHESNVWDSGGEMLLPWSSCHVMRKAVKVFNEAKYPKGFKVKVTRMENTKKGWLCDEYESIGTGGDR